MKDFVNWLNEGWGFLIIVSGGITLIWGFRKTIKEIIKELKSPFTELDTKIDKINEKLHEIVAHDERADRALLTLQRKSLLDACGEYLEAGFATMEEKSTISDQYTSYSELGGDSFISDMVAEVMNLPISAPVKETKKRTKKK